MTDEIDGGWDDHRTFECEYPGCDRLHINRGAALRCCSMKDPDEWTGAVRDPANPPEASDE